MTDDASPGSAGEKVPPGVDPNVAHVARIWNYWLGDKDNYEVDRQVGDQILAMLPDVARLVRAHARVLLTSTLEGVTDYIEADLRDPDTILREAARTLDFDQPIALMLMGIVEFITDNDEAYAIVRRLLDAPPSGSYLAFYDGTNVVHREASDRIAQVWNESGNTPVATRTQPFDSLDEVDAFCAVGRKP
ncbi:MAG: hypothetical protein GEV03_20300 [Streptosporangiales bacterium]|nr:hypothetical protein [Streptosporangiales bacterium]